MEDLPCQRGSTACGVLLILCANYLSLGQPLLYHEGDVPNARKRICCDLIRGSLGRLEGDLQNIHLSLDWVEDLWTGPHLSKMFSNGRDVPTSAPNAPPLVSAGG